MKQSQGLILGKAYRLASFKGFMNRFRGCKGKAEIVAIASRGLLADQSGLLSITSSFFSQDSQ